MVVPIGASSFMQEILISTEVYRNLKEIITDRYGKAATGLSDEGCLAPPISTIDEALELLEQAGIWLRHRSRW